MLEEQLRELKT